MHKTLKALFGLALVPAVLPLVGMLYLSSCHEARALRQDFWRCFRRDLWRVFNDRMFWGDVVTSIFVVTLSLAGCGCLLTHQWGSAVMALSSAAWMAWRA